MDSYGVRFSLPAGAGRGLHFLIVEGRSYPDIVDEMKRGATAAIEQAGATCEVIAVPSAMEVPVAMAMAIETGRFDGYVALGCVIRGQTNHYVSVANESIRALAELAVVDALPLGIGILTVENEAQAWIRAHVNDQDRGGDAARAAIALSDVKAKLNT
ncbi:6,7-dimethyl-8-ribityllumazine synthase [Devosia sp. XJ19-1]|uniref:6,7-dimethyl-8-ribityllumazine synthase n=1 Tax=Devosia ureilytica TaxID=2952754 RepID=A0A9Q4FQ80_9HYPH|nr:6,7-dimethyl-8-ribityllumazine synthase [Devosia ureilytica]MCP8882507.1 6,7-dimethyl-8-ribityllumazine synthase [Devosia ureilytica]MCP8885606.1 6,7-dimethyl-8-ribityllumazine synthase [Devosia ureilytica]